MRVAAGWPWRVSRTGVAGPVAGPLEPVEHPRGRVLLGIRRLVPHGRLEPAQA